MADDRDPFEGLDPRFSKLHEFATLVDKKFGRGSIGTAHENLVLDMPRIPTGSMMLDYALGGGIPRGRIVMFFGRKSGGKTTNSKRIVGQAQKLCRNCFRPVKNLEVCSTKVVRDGEEREVFYAVGECDCYKIGLFRPVRYKRFNKKGMLEDVPITEHEARMKQYEVNSYEELICGYVDTEGTFDKDWAMRVGCDPRRVMYYRPPTAEEAIDIYDPWVRTGAVDFLVVDTLAFLTPRTEVEESSENWQQGLQARLINKFCVDGNARVVTKAGVVKRLSEVVPGDELRSVLKDGRVVWRMVRDIWSNGVRPVVRMKNGLVLTPDHEAAAKQSSEPGILFRRADESGEGCVLARPRVSPHDGDESWGGGKARLLGYLVGDGCWKSWGGPSLCSFDAEATDEIQRILSEFGCRLNEKDWQVVKGDDLPGGSSRNPVRRWLEGIGVDFGTKARSKVFPESVFRLNLGELAEAIGGLWMADGWVAVDGKHVGLTTTSYKLAWQVWEILLRLGVWVSVRPVEATDSFRLTVTGNNVKRFKDVVRLVGKKARQLDSIVDLVGAGCCDQDWMPDFAVDEIKKLVSGRMVAELLRNVRQTYPEWNKPGRVKLDRRVLHRIGLAYDEIGGARLREIADEQVWWERCEDAEPFGEAEVFDVEVEWDDADGEPNFEVGGVFVHNCRKVASAMSACARQWGRSPTQIWCNQVRMKIGQYSGEVMPGGMGQGFSTSIEVKHWPTKPEIEKIDVGKKGEEIEIPLWVDIKYKVEKNKTAPSGVEGYYRMILTDTETKLKGEISEEEQVFRYAKHFKLIDKVEKGGKVVGWVYDGKKFKTQAEIEVTIMENPDEWARLRKMLIDLLLQKVT